MKISKSKRLWVTLGVTAVNIIIFVLGVIYKRLDPISLGTGLSMINAPIYAYLGMESWRPSNNKKNEDRV